VTSAEEAASVTTPATSIAVLIAITAIGPLSMQMFLPALPAIQGHFAVAPGVAQLALSLSMVSIAVMTIVFGPISDRLGRRPVILAGMALMIAGSVLCAVAPDIDTLIIGRIIQAAGGASGMVLARAVVRDVYGPTRAAGIIAYLGAAMVIAPMLAPTIGGLLLDHVHWRSVFVFMTFVGILVLGAVHLRLAESHRPGLVKTTLPGLVRGFSHLLASRRFCAYAFNGAFAISVFFAFVSYAPYVMVEILNRPATEYGLYFIALSLGFMLGNFTAAKISERVGNERMVLLGSLVSLLGTGAMAAIAVTSAWTPIGLFGPAIVAVFGNGLAMPNAQAGALNVAPESAGTASGLTGFLQMGIAAVVAQAVGTMQDGTPYPMIAFMAGGALLALAVFAVPMWLERRAAT